MPYMNAPQSPASIDRSQCQIYLKLINKINVIIKKSVLTSLLGRPYSRAMLSIGSAFVPLHEVLEGVLGVLLVVVVVAVFPPIRCIRIVSVPSELTAIKVHII